MSLPAFLVRLGVFAALAALCGLPDDPALREMLFAVLIVYSLRVLFAPNLAFPQDGKTRWPGFPPDR